MTGTTDVMPLEMRASCVEGFVAAYRQLVEAWARGELDLESMSQRKLCHVDKVDGKIAVKEGPIVHIALNMVPTDPFWRAEMEHSRKLTELEGFDDEKKGSNDAGDAGTNDQEVNHGDEGK